MINEIIWNLAFFLTGAALSAYLMHWSAEEKYIEGLMDGADRSWEIYIEQLAKRCEKERDE